MAFDHDLTRFPLNGLHTVVTAPGLDYALALCGQRNTGTAYLVEPVFAKAEFQFTSGTPKTYDAVSEGSGKRVTTHFCGTCGVRLLLTFERFPDAVGTFAAASRHVRRRESGRCARSRVTGVRSPVGLSSDTPPHGS